MKARVLFYKPGLSFPFASGHDVHTTQMCRAMAALGVATCFVTDKPVPPASVPFIGAGDYVSLDDEAGTGEDLPPVRLSSLQERFRGYWGVSEMRVRRLGAIARRFGADTVVVSGLGVLPMLGAVPEGVVRVWYAADEWVIHHLSLVRLTAPATWSELKPAFIKGVYERAYRGLADRVWVVTESDARATRWVMAPRGVDLLPNGVDAEFYQPLDVPQVANSAVFWGRLDFGPNVQALEWFAGHVWPTIRSKVPDATFRVIGFQPSDAVRRLARRDGIELLPDVDDIRPVIASRAVVVLPFISGAGIKNKCLEAAAMGRPIVASPIAALGLQGSPPVRLAKTPAEWVNALSGLWHDAAGAAALGRAARDWVVEAHNWQAVAMRALTTAK